MKIELTSRGVGRFLVLAICGLIVAHLCGQSLVFKTGDDYLYGLGPMFDLDDEANLPTLFASLAMLFAAVVMMTISRFDGVDSMHRRYWIFLAMVFFVIGVDETISLHELVGNIFDTRFDTSGYLYYSWVIPYFFLSLGLFLISLRFLLQLPVKVRVLMVSAGLLYVLGAIGLEAVSARHDELHGADTLTYAVVSTFEEIFELSGVAIFIYALLLYVEEEHGVL